MQKITIITNTIRRPIELVEKSIHASLGQNESVPVILIDQNSELLRFSDEIKSNSRLNHVHCQVPSVSMARNQAQYSADTEWLIFCDDDGYLQSGYIDQLELLIKKNPDIDLFAGSIKRIDNGEFYSKRHAIGGDMKWFWNAKLLMGSNFVIRRSVFESLGKFDELFGAGAPYGSSEETDLAWNAFFNGFKMSYTPELVVFHVAPFAGELKQELKKAFRYGLGKGVLVRKFILKGKFKVLFEILEMMILPFLRLPMFFLKFKYKEVLIQIATFCGRFYGLFIMRFY
jgi:GT2 family glycosyltransferase